jgi:hypothetical protein
MKKMKMEVKTPQTSPKLLIKSVKEIQLAVAFPGHHETAQTIPIKFRSIPSKSPANKQPLHSTQPFPNLPKHLSSQLQALQLYHQKTTQTSNPQSLQKILVSAHFNMKF